MGRVVVRRLGLLVTGGGAVVRSGRHCCGGPLQAARLAVETSGYGRVKQAESPPYSWMRLGWPFGRAAGQTNLLEWGKERAASRGAVTT